MTQVSQDFWKQEAINSDAQNMIVGDSIILDLDQFRKFISKMKELEINYSYLKGSSTEYRGLIYDMEEVAEEFKELPF